MIKANCINLGGYGVLLLGSSGSGKSLLTLALLERAALFHRTALLVSDDYTGLTINDDCLMAHSPPNIAGLIEIRGAGVYQMPYQKEVPIKLVVMLNGTGERYPHGHQWSWTDENSQKSLNLPLLKLPQIDKADSIALCHAIEAWLFMSRKENIVILDNN